MYGPPQISHTSSLPSSRTSPARLRAVLTVSYPHIVDQQGNPIYAKFKELGKGIIREDYYYYRSGDSFVFVGHGGRSGDSAAINLGYLEYSRSFQHYAATGDRPAQYFDETEAWSYATTYDVDDTTRENARKLVSNWVLFNWFDVVIEGTLAKLYKLVDDARAVASFSFFERQKRVIQSGETTAYASFNR